MNPTRRDLARLGLGFGLALALPRRAAAAPDPMSKEAVLFDPDAPVLGNPKGDVTIVEFFDFQCPYCKKAHPDVARLVRDDGRIRHVMKDWPIFGPPSLYASRLVLGAGKDSTKARDALMATPGRLTAEQIDATLRKAGLDPQAMNAAYGKDRARVDALIERNGVQAENFNLMGTPAYIVGTTLFPGVMDVADMKRAVAEARRG